MATLTPSIAAIPLAFGIVRAASDRRLVEAETNRLYLSERNAGDENLNLYLLCVGSGEKKKKKSPRGRFNRAI